MFKNINLYFIVFLLFTFVTDSTACVSSFQTETRTKFSEWMSQKQLAEVVENNLEQSSKRVYQLEYREPPFNVKNKSDWISYETLNQYVNDISTTRTPRQYRIRHKPKRLVDKVAETAGGRAAIAATQTTATAAQNVTNAVAQTYRQHEEALTAKRGEDAEATKIGTLATVGRAATATAVSLGVAGGSASVSAVSNLGKKVSDARANRTEAKAKKKAEKAATTAETAPEAKPEDTAQKQVETAQDAKPETAQAQDARPETAQDAKPETAPDAKPIDIAAKEAQDAKPAETAPETKTETAPDAKPTDTAQDAKPENTSQKPEDTTNTNVQETAEPAQETVQESSGILARTTQAVKSLTHFTFGDAAVSAGSTAISAATNLLPRRKKPTQEAKSEDTAQKPTETAPEAVAQTNQNVPSIVLIQKIRDHLNLSRRVIKALHAENIVLVTDLIHKNEQDLLAFINNRQVKAIKDALAEKGLFLGYKPYTGAIVPVSKEVPIEVLESRIEDFLSLPKKISDGLQSENIFFMKDLLSRTEARLEFEVGESWTTKIKDALAEKELSLPKDPQEAKPAETAQEDTTETAQAQDTKPQTAQAQDARPETAQEAKPATIQETKTEIAQDAKPEDSVAQTKDVQDTKPETAQDAKPQTAPEAAQENAESTQESVQGRSLFAGARQTLQGLANLTFGDAAVSAGSTAISAATNLLPRRKKPEDTTATAARETETAQDTKPQTAQAQDARPETAQEAKPEDTAARETETAQDTKPQTAQARDTAQDAKPEDSVAQTKDVQDTKPETAQDAKPQTAQEATQENAEPTQETVQESSGILARTTQAAKDLAHSTFGTATISAGSTVVSAATNLLSRRKKPTQEAKPEDTQKPTETTQQTQQDTATQKLEELPPEVLDSRVEDYLPISEKTVTELNSYLIFSMKDLLKMNESDLINFIGADPVKEIKDVLAEKNLRLFEDTRPARPMSLPIPPPPNPPRQEKTAQDTKPEDTAARETETAQAQDAKPETAQEAKPEDSVAQTKDAQGTKPETAQDTKPEDTAQKPVETDTKPEDTQKPAETAQDAKPEDTAAQTKDAQDAKPTDTAQDAKPQTAQGTVAQKLEQLPSILHIQIENYLSLTSTTIHALKAKRIYSMQDLFLSEPDLILEVGEVAAKEIKTALARKNLALPLATSPQTAQRIARNKQKSEFRVRLETAAQERRIPLEVVDQKVVDYLDLGTRLNRLLTTEEIITMGDLLLREEKDLLYIRQLGRTSVEIIKENLAEKGLALGLQLPSPPSEHLGGWARI